MASFYYSYREGEQQTNHSNMLRSVLFDILNQNEEFFFHFQPYYREVSQGGGHPEWCYESLKGVLLSLTKNHPLRERLYLIVDAMDESDDGERTDVVKFLRDLCAAEGPCIVKVFVASRPIGELSGHSTRNQKVIRLQDVNRSDILRFTASFLDSPELDLPPDVAHLATEYIAENAQGVFVWVHLVREELLEYASDGYTKNQIFEFLKCLPTELEGIYKRILMRLERGRGRNVEDGQKMLQYVLLAYRPLGLDELGQALAIRDNLDSGFSCSDELFEGDLIRGIEKRIITCAGNFLEIKARGDHGSSFSLSRKILLTNGSAESSVVQVMHQTVREFFRPDGPTAQSKFRMNSNDDHLKMSTTCVRYLMLCASKAASIDQAAGSKPWTPEHFEVYAEYLSGRPFFSYALSFVKRHLQQCGQVARDSELVSQLSSKLNETPAAHVLGNWIPETWGQRIIGCEQQDYSKDFRAKLLHTATHMGYPQVVEALLIGGAEIEACLGGHTPLMVAAESGNLVTPQVLLDQKALVGAREGNNRLALHLAAALRGSEVIVRLLLDRGADVNAQGGEYGHALQAAVSQKSEVIVRLLLDRGADINAQGGVYGNALQAAASYGSEVIVRLLLDQGADINAQGGEYGNALQAAAAKGSEVIVRHLLERGADINAQGGKYGNALQAAVSQKSEVIVRLLLDQGADVNAQGGKYGNALQAAAPKGSEVIVRHLLDRGADINAQGGVYGNALQAAVSQKSEVIVRLLLDRGADVNAQGGKRNSDHTAH